MNERLIDDIKYDWKHDQNIGPVEINILFERLEELGIANSGLYGRVSKSQDENNKLWIDNQRYKQALERFEIRALHLDKIGRRYNPIEIIDEVREALAGENNET